MPTRSNGKICYLEIPSKNVDESATFYNKVFGWNIRKRGDGATAFDDSTGEVSGTWVTERSPVRQGSLLLYIMVDEIDEAVKKVTSNGGQIVRPVGMDAPEITAQFRDPAGNIIGLYQEPKR